MPLRMGVTASAGDTARVVQSPGMNHLGEGAGPGGDPSGGPRIAVRRDSGLRIACLSVPSAGISPWL